MRATVANSLAEALINGIDNAAQNGQPLSLLQQQYMAAMSIMAYDNALLACETLKVSADLERHFSGSSED